MEIDLASIIQPINLLETHGQSIAELAKRHQDEYDGLFDPGYGQPLRYYMLFTHEPSLLGIEISPLAVFYNRYYWFQSFKAAHKRHHGYSAGLEQQAFKILEEAHEHNGLDLDLLIIDAIDKLFDHV